LHALNVGDEYWVFYGGDKHRYVIKEKKEVKPSDVSVLDQPVNKRLSTLMTCTPVGTTLRRLIIVAQEVDPLTAEPLEVGEHIADERLPKMQMEMLPI
jgi:LPXTG-site transpeptidase (sortase) family protein